MENSDIKLSLHEKLLKKINTPALESFFMGKWYPLVVALLVLLGHSLGLEVYLCVINVLLFALSMAVCNSVRPFITVLCTFLFQVPLLHSPGGPAWSDHYVKGANPYLLALAVIVAVSTIVYAIIKFKVFKSLSFRDTPLLTSMCVLGAAFMLNGAFSSTWQPRDLLYGAVQAMLFPLCFLVFYKGLKAEKKLDELALYVSYTAAVMGVLLALEMADLYIFGNDIYGSVFDPKGSVIKDRIHLGWATWNPVGVAIAVLVPAIFIGVIKSKHSWVYFLSAAVTCLAAILTFSRNAMIVSSLAFVASLLIACFFGEKRRKTAYRIITALGALLMLFFIIVLWDKIKIFADDIFKRGLSDNGRFKVWAVAIQNFKSKPVFGTGFYYFTSPYLYNYSPAIPLMAHQTFLQLLSSMGFVGLVAYVYYRLDTAEMFFKRPTVYKTLLGLSVLVLLIESMLDNFIFTIFPLFFYSVALAVSALIYEKQIEDDLLKKRGKKNRRK